MHWIRNLRKKKNAENTTKRKKKMHWIEEAKTKNAEYEILEDNRVIWHNGIWYNGIWNDGVWHNGVWNKTQQKGRKKN